MADFGGVRSSNMFDVLTQPKKEKPLSKQEITAAKKEAKKVAAVAPAPAPRPERERTGNKRGGIANKGTRPQNQKNQVSDFRGKRLQDRQSEQNFEKNHGGAAKGGRNYGGVQDLQTEARDAAEIHNTTGSDVLTAAEVDAKEQAEKEAKELAEKKRKEEEEENKTKSFATYEAERKAAALAGDLKEARKPIVGKEFKTGDVKVSSKGKEESFMKVDREQPKVEEKKAGAADKKPKSGSKAAEAKKAAPKPAKKVLNIAEFVGDAPAASSAPASARSEAPRADRPAGPRADGGAPRGGRGGARGGARGGRGGRGGRGAGAALDFGAAFPPLGGKA